MSKSSINFKQKRKFTKDKVGDLYDEIEKLSASYRKESLLKSRTSLKLCAYERKLIFEPLTRKGSHHKKESNINFPQMEAQNEEQGEDDNKGNGETAKNEKIKAIRKFKENLDAPVTKKELNDMITQLNNNVIGYLNEKVITKLNSLEASINKKLNEILDKI